MSSIWGNKLKISIFGESHGKGIGVVIDGFPAGFKVDREYIDMQMKRRAPGRSRLQTSRVESDEPQIISGIFNGITTGSPICAVINNDDRRSSDYEKIKDTPRPGHSDYPAHVKYHGFNDYRGGGHFSGRLTAPLVFAGALCRSYLKEKYNIMIGSHINCIGNVFDGDIDEFMKKISNRKTVNLIGNDVISASLTELERLYYSMQNNNFPTIDVEVVEKMKLEIENAKSNGDSIGGEIQAFILNMPVGVGEPMFDSFESRMAHILFSIPAIKGVEFGDGFNLATMRGSEANDNYDISDGKIVTKSNHNGGITGGLTNGMPVVFNVAIKPTPSISIEQDTVSLSDLKPTKIKVDGRHDPCIVQRAIPVIECAAAIVVMDFII